MTKIAKSSYKANSIDSGGIQVYASDIYFYADEYSEQMLDKSDLSKQSSSAFTGMLKYINQQMHFNPKMYEDIDLLDNLWSIYTDLVYRYNQKPTILEYSVFIGINPDTIYSWIRGECRDDYSVKLSDKRVSIVTKWLRECKLGRYKGAAAGNVGYIFLCKAVDGMTETAPVQVAQKQTITAQQLPKLSDNSNVIDAD